MVEKNPKASNIGGDIRNKIVVRSIKRIFNHLILMSQNKSHFENSRYDCYREEKETRIVPKVKINKLKL